MRLLIGGASSNCGKTTVALSVMAALKAKGLNVAPLKVGPDYIDPGFHAAACGRVSNNLDMHLMGRDAVCSVLASSEASSDVAVIEGVMGYYDGLDPVSLRCSTYEMAHLTRTPAVLVVDASGGAASVAATVKGFLSLVPESGICGVIVNRVSSQTHYALVRDAIAHYTSLPCAGCLLKDAALDLPSRHLGLVPAQETDTLEEKLRHAAHNALETIDLDMLLSFAQKSPKLECGISPLPQRLGYRLGIARDDAFSFYYAENIRMLRESGMELIAFSPLNDAHLPERLDGLYLGGGFPEVFADRLCANRAMRESIRRALEGGLRCYAECGGLLYLSRRIDGREMVGFLPIECRMTKRLQRFGYVTVEDESGLTYPAHEFHHAVAEPAEPIHCAFTVRKASAPEKTWKCGYRRGNTLAGFPHLHFLAHPELIERLWP